MACDPQRPLAAVRGRLDRLARGPAHLADAAAPLGRGVRLAARLPWLEARAEGRPLDGRRGPAAARDHGAALTRLIVDAERALRTAIGDEAGPLAALPDAHVGRQPPHEVRALQREAATRDREAAAHGIELLDQHVAMAANDAADRARPDLGVEEADLAPERVRNDNGALLVAAQGHELRVDELDALPTCRLDHRPAAHRVGAMHDDPRIRPAAIVAERDAVVGGVEERASHVLLRAAAEDDALEVLPLELDDAAEVAPRRGQALVEPRGVVGVELHVLDPPVAVALADEQPSAKGRARQVADDVPRALVGPEVGALPGIAQRHVAQPTAGAERPDRPRVGDGVEGILLGVPHREAPQPRLRFQADERGAVLLPAPRRWHEHGAAGDGVVGHVEAASQLDACRHSQLAGETIVARRHVDGAAACLPRSLERLGECGGVVFSRRSGAELGDDEQLAGAGLAGRRRRVFGGAGVREVQRRVDDLHVALAQVLDVLLPERVIRGDDLGAAHLLAKTHNGLGAR